MKIEIGKFLCDKIQRAISIAEVGSYRGLKEDSIRELNELRQSISMGIESAFLNHIGANNE